MHQIVHKHLSDSLRINSDCENEMVCFRQLFYTNDDWLN